MKHKRKHVLFLLLNVLLACQAFTQNQPAFIQIQEDRGLQSNTIYNIHVARNGLLYIAHSKGLSSFDGNAFINYYNQLHPFTEVTNVLESSNGNIFCKAFNNSLYQLNKDSVYHCKDVTSKLGFAPSSATKQTLVSIINDSLQFINTNTKKSFSKALKNAKILTSTLASPVFIGSGLQNNVPYLFIVDSLLNIYRLPNDIFPAGKHHYCNGNIFLVDSKNPKEIVYYNQNKMFSLPNTGINFSINYIATTNNTIWVCTTDGIFYKSMNDGGDKFMHILTGFNVSCIAQTKENNFFVSTIGKGLLFIPNFNVQTTVESHQPIKAITVHKNHLITSSSFGTINSYLLGTKQFTIKHSKEIGDVKFIWKDSLLNIDILSAEKTFINNQLFNFVVKDICIIKNNILLATNNGVYLYKTKQSTYTWVEEYAINKGNNSILKLSFSNEHTSNIKYNAAEDIIYISNYTGLMQLKNGDPEASKLPEPNCVLKDICVYNQKLLLASKDKGILQWNGKSYEPAFFNNPTDGILYKFEVYKNELWIVGENAIFCYAQNQLYRYASDIGITAKNVASLAINDDDVFLNTGYSVLRFPKKSIVQASSAPSFILNKVMNVNGNDTISNYQKLPNNYNTINLNFSLISYANAANTHVAYSINGLPIVHLAADIRQLPLTSLKADSYTILFYLVSNNRLNSKPVGSFSFTIQPSFYNTWWFYLLIAIIISTITFYLVKYRIKKIKQALALKQSKLLLERELDKSTLLGIKAQMNPHFIFNALNTIQSYVYMNDKRNAGIYISKFSDLTRSILDMSNKEFISLQEEVNALEIYLSLEKMRFEDSFDYSIQVAATLRKDSTQIPSMLIQPYVENAIKHGLLHRKTNRVLQIVFEKNDNYLQVIIDDNGIGRKRSEEINKSNQRRHQSFALAANKKRLDILKQHFNNINLTIIDKISPLGEPEGTRVIITLPIQM
ncbi:MAG: histidine kinase [Chitinophagaceae bacterium]|jgi:hypothetical protein|nr:histidine kinase [Chitinophagaceae bacterium]